MKGRESGMPEEDHWDSFFDAECLIEKLVPLHIKCGDIAELGSGYGTFTIPAARKTSGLIHGFDIESNLVTIVQDKCKRQGITNARLEQRDFIEQGTGLPSASVEHVMIYNILHIEYPIKLLQEVFRILKPNGTASVIHWRTDIQTPRGPSMEIRPSIEQCKDWARATGFVQQEQITVSTCARYHYGLLLARPKTVNKNWENT
ncbi:MAG: ubiquinone/menaquinone biosynthesis C-methylase UbiE [Planctomycetota bacterium]|jgi:ubiquinone/menaquinone biosynthesis C-methylase UbiE